MKWTQAFLKTLKEDPAEAEVISHKLMIRSGLIRKLGSGAYTYLPLGFKVLKKIEAIVREEMDSAGAEELLMPAIQPKELWDKTGRFEVLGDIIITFKDRHGKVALLGPTHEEIITDLVSREVRSYRDLPRTLYQIQTKFRDEPRPRFGVLRLKEFIMKDAYSFDIDVAGLNKSYKAMYDAYSRIFERCGLNYITVEADTGFMGGDVSHEFMVPSTSGEDIITTCPGCGYKASLTMAECLKSKDKTPKTKVEKVIKKVSTPGVSTVEKVSLFLKVKPDQLVKTLLYIADGKPLAVLVRGDHDLNETKLARHLKSQVLQMADDKAILELTGGAVGFSGPVGLKGLKIIADYEIEGMNNFITGANKTDTHLTNVNLTRDFKVNGWADLRYAAEGDMCPKCSKKKLNLEKTIEVGHTFKLGTKYSKSLSADFLDKDGKGKPCIMGCYGIGINRIIAAVIEQNNDKDGIIWPSSISPYRIVVIPINVLEKEQSSKALEIYKSLEEAGFEVLLDDRDERAGLKFKDADLIGIPLRLVVSGKHLAKGKIEAKLRSSKNPIFLDEKNIVKDVKKTLEKED